MAKFFLFLAVSLLVTFTPSLQRFTSPPSPSVSLTSNKTVTEIGEQAVLSCTVSNLVVNAPFRITFFSEGSTWMYWYTVSHENGVWSTNVTRRGTNYFDLEAEPVASAWPVYRLGVVAKTAVKHTYTCELFCEPYRKEGIYLSNKVEITAKANK